MLPLQYCCKRNCNITAGYNTGLSCNVEDLKEVIRKHRATVLRCIDPLSGLLDHRELQEIEDEELRGIVNENRSGRKQSSIDLLIVGNKLLDCVLNLDENPLKIFLKALKEKGQEHIVNFVNDNGGKYVKLVSNTPICGLAIRNRGVTVPL